MAEPLYAPLRTPAGGWPRCARRVELIGDLTLDDAVYALADRARLEHIVHVALFQGTDLWAYPHQTTAEIAANFRRMRAMEAAHLVRALKPGVMRWTAQAKLALVLAARELFVERRDLLTVYGVSAAELADWELRYDRFGLDGLMTRQVQTLRLSPPSPDALAESPFKGEAARG